MFFIIKKKILKNSFSFCFSIIIIVLFCDTIFMKYTSCKYLLNPYGNFLESQHLEMKKTAGAWPGPGLLSIANNVVEYMAPNFRPLTIRTFESSCFIGMCETKGLQDDDYRERGQIHSKEKNTKNAKIIQLPNELNSFKTKS